MISIILPSIRRPQVFTTIDSIVEAADGVDFEIILVTNMSTFRTPVYKLKTIIEQEQCGPISAINLGIQHAEGEYIFSINDESTLAPGSLLALQNTCHEQYDDFVIMSPVHLPQYPFFYYGKWFAPFPFLHRDVIKDLGGFYDPAFKGFYGDPDLSMRAYAAGIPVVECGGAVIDHRNDIGRADHVHNVNAYLEQDRAEFRKRWDHLGEFRDP